MSAIHLKVSVGKQRVELYRGDNLQFTYAVSTSKFGLGSEVGSYKTPLGEHYIAQKIGDGLPQGAVLRSRQWTGSIWQPEDPYQLEEDLVLSRILWLEGREAKNQTSFNRYIYIHGTNQEYLIGTPASHGCVRMKNEAVIALFDQVEVGTRVALVEE